MHLGDLALKFLLIVQKNNRKVPIDNPSFVNYTPSMDNVEVAPSMLDAQLDAYCHERPEIAAIGDRPRRSDRNHLVRRSVLGEPTSDHLPVAADSGLELDADDRAMGEGVPGEGGDAVPGQEGE